MNRVYLIALIAAFTSFAAHAAEPGAVAAKPAQAVPTSAATAPKMSQQDKMRECSKQATGKKGAERKAFMKTCLSRKT